MLVHVLREVAFELILRQGGDSLASRGIGLADSQVGKRYGIRVCRRRWRDGSGVLIARRRVDKLDFMKEFAQLSFCP